MPAVWLAAAAASLAGWLWSIASGQAALCALSGAATVLALVLFGQAQAAAEHEAEAEEALRALRPEETE